jgi:predicted small metal-binding protein
MTLSINCKDAGKPVCTHSMYGKTEEEVLKNAKEHRIREHGYTEESRNEILSKNLEHFKKIIKQV